MRIVALDGEAVGPAACPDRGFARAYPGNPRRGNLEAIRDSLAENVRHRPIVVNRRSMEVLAGNHTLAAARRLGWSEIAATFVDVDAEAARRIVLVDNRTNDLAAYDEAELLELLEACEELDGTGYGQHDLDELLEEVRDRYRSRGRSSRRRRRRASRRRGPGISTRSATTACSAAMRGILSGSAN